ncbi:hypothetical protein [Rubritalea tangerina]|uniref:DUF2127 domain-containing protein n=1 Tax=Rubritalea tangerina TaxID=430798 RepID=A0ABW4Z935_9BACT
MSQQGMSAYEPEDDLAQPPALPEKREGITKVWGILHIIFGGLSLLGGVMKLFTQGSLVPGVEAEFKKSGMLDAMDEASLEEALSGVEVPNLVLGYLDYGVGLLLLLAGVGLVRYARWGRMLSNVYVVASIAVKVVSGYVLMVLATPFFEFLVANDVTLVEAGFSGSHVQMAMLLALVVSSVYAIATLVVVNLSRVKRSLA